MCEKFHQLLAVGRWFPPGTPVSSTIKLISSSFHRLEMTLAVAKALNPNKPNQKNIHRCSILIGHPFDCCNSGYVVLRLRNSSLNTKEEFPTSLHSGLNFNRITEGSAVDDQDIQRHLVMHLVVTLAVCMPPGIRQVNSGAKDPWRTTLRLNSHPVLVSYVPLSSGSRGGEG